jgi:hypothetical protein
MERKADTTQTGWTVLRITILRTCTPNAAPKPITKCSTTSHKTLDVLQAAPLKDDTVPATKYSL